MRYYDNIITKRNLMNMDIYEKNKYAVKKYDIIKNGIFRKLMNERLYDIDNPKLQKAIKLLEQPFLYILLELKKLSNFQNYMIQ